MKQNMMTLLAPISMRHHFPLRSRRNRKDETPLQCSCGLLSSAARSAHSGVPNVTMRVINQLRSSRGLPLRLERNITKEFVAGSERSEIVLEIPISHKVTVAKSAASRCVVSAWTA
jgi:hypothetical protein